MLRGHVHRRAAIAVNIYELRSFIGFYSCRHTADIITENYRECGCYVDTRR